MKQPTTVELHAYCQFSTSPHPKLRVMDITGWQIFSLQPLIDAFPSLQIIYAEGATIPNSPTPDTVPCVMTFDLQDATTQTLEVFQVTQ